MTNKMIERLKDDRGYPGQVSIIRALNKLMFTFGYDEDSGGIYAMDQGGYMMTETEFNDLVDGMQAFINYHGNDDIVQFNKEVDERREARRHEATPEKPRRRTPGFVYLIRAENGLYKIGKAKDVSARMQPFSVHFPMKWELIHSVKSDDYSYTEEFLHLKFADKRDVGEWFRLTPADVAYITAL
jgi:hypothetical protein